MAPASPTWSDLSVVVTAGPTREHLDDVRFLSNASTGRMGIELARVARARGARVTLVLGPTTLTAPAGVEVVPVVSTDDLLRATRAAVKGADLVLFAAAPSDYRPGRRRRGKPAREGGALTLRLEPTPDVAATLGARKGRRVHVGFALEVTGGPARARRKLERKHLDAIVLNSPANFGKGGGAASWIDEGGKRERLPTASKRTLAGAILTRCLALVRSLRA
ncbi:MAG: phosphopantothenoylcysteine decarboxylase [Planctomycetota bacterium]|nr:phosphopantothenoylcysteine decarboxylase [Planctomycetota bacterium]